MNGLKVFASISRIHIVAIGAMGTLTFGWLFTGRYPAALAAICALDWFLVNLLNRVVDIKEDRQNRITGVDFVDAHRAAIMRLGFALLILSFPLFHALFPQITPLRVAYHALGLTYNWPLLPGRRRIKALYFFKNAASGLGFIITVFLYPLALAGWGTNPARLAPEITPVTIWVSGLFFLLFELSYEVIYDLRDEPGDRAAGVRTYPVVHGLKGAMRITDALIYASAMVITAGWLAQVVPWRIFVMVLAPFINLWVYKRAMKRGITSRDCIRLTWAGAALLAAYHLWILAGLPGVGAAT